MARTLLAGAVVAATLAAAGSAAAGQVPILRSARVSGRQLVLELSVRDLRPAQLVVSKRRAVGPGGALLSKNVRLRETIELPAADTGTVLWKSRKTLQTGIYFVQVTAIETGGVTDCPRFLPNCLDRWSNVRRVVVPAAH